VISKRVDAPLLAVGFYVGNLLIMVLISALVKVLAENYPVSQILFFRYVFAVIPLFVYMMLTQGISSMKTSRPGAHAVRSISGVVSISLFFYAIALIPLAEATMLGYASPIFITLLSIFVLSERIGPRRWFAVIAGFIGVIVITRPGSEIFSIGSLFAIGSAMTAALVVVWLRLLSDTENPITTSIIYNTLGAAVFAVWAWIVGWMSVDSGLHWILLIAVGLCASVQQFCFAIAFKYGEASMLAPFEYLILIFSGLTGYLFWSEVPAPSSIIGGVIIVLSGLIIIARSRKTRGLSTEKT
jgi:drug/metabolite transporter (DMT)-like permease